MFSNWLLAKAGWLQLFLSAWAFWPHVWPVSLSPQDPASIAHYKLPVWYPLCFLFFHVNSYLSTFHTQSFSMYTLEVHAVLHNQTCSNTGLQPSVPLCRLNLCELSRPLALQKGKRYIFRINRKNLAALGRFSQHPPSVIILGLWNQFFLGGTCFSPFTK